MAGLRLYSLGTAELDPEPSTKGLALHSLLLSQAAFPEEGARQSGKGLLQVKSCCLVCRGGVAAGAGVVVVDGGGDISMFTTLRNRLFFRKQKFGCAQ